MRTKTSWKPSLALELGAFGFFGLFWGCFAVLLADLAAAKGHKAEAAQAYRLFIGMWDRGDPEVQPIVGRARRALAGLGG